MTASPFRTIRWTTCCHPGARPANTNEGRDGFSTGGLGAIHRRSSCTTSEPSEEPSPFAELRRLGRPAVSVCLHVFGALPLDRQDSIQCCNLGLDGLPRADSITSFPTGRITVCLKIDKPGLRIRKHCFQALYVPG